MFVLFDKMFYLTLTSVAMGVVSVAVWNALIVDRRDGFILGVLPVRRSAIVAAKLLSLAAYVGALNLGMHAGAALLFGAALGEGRAGIGRGMAGPPRRGLGRGHVRVPVGRGTRERVPGGRGPPSLCASRRAAAGAARRLGHHHVSHAPWLARGAVSLGEAAAPPPGGCSTCR